MTRLLRGAKDEWSIQSRRRRRLEATGDNEASSSEPTTTLARNESTEETLPPQLLNNSNNDNNTDLFSKNKGAAIGVLSLLVVLVLAFCYWNSRRKRARTEDDEDETDRTDVATMPPSNHRRHYYHHAPPVGTPWERRAREMAVARDRRAWAVAIANMNEDERIELYNDAFDRNKNQLVVEASRIIVHDHESSSHRTEEEEDEEDSEIFGEHEDPSIYLALSASRRRRSTRLARKFTSSQCPTRSSTRRSSLIHPSASFSGGSFSLTGSPAPLMVRGHCVICFEAIEAGETIVWSESSTCPHVYHKECLVAFLAHRKPTVEQAEADDHPCPTCRQPFVTLLGGAPRAPKGCPTIVDDSTTTAATENVTEAGGSDSRSHSSINSSSLQDRVNDDDDTDGD